MATPDTPLIKGSDCTFMQQFAAGVQTGDLRSDQSEGIADLRMRLLGTATAIGEQLAEGWRPFKSEVNRPSISGHVAKLLWSCAYPTASPHKSFGLQAALIVRPEGVELCFCLGAGGSQSKSAERRDELSREFARVHERMRTAPPRVVEACARAIPTGWVFRRKWLMPSAPGDFGSFAEWLAYAGASSDGGASISRYLPPDEVDAAASGFVDELVALSRAVRPLIDWVYPDDGDEDGDGPTTTEGSTSVDAPAGFRRELFDAAVAELKRDRLEHGDLHQLACRQLSAWIERRRSLSDAELWAGLRDRFLPFGHVEVDGERYRATSTLPLTDAELRTAEREGRAIAHGNLHWTGLARAVGSEREDVPAIRAAIDWLLDESIPYGNRIAALVGGERHVRGFGIAVWTGFYAMVRDWAQPTVNETVIGAYEKLGWPLTAQGPVEQVAEVRSRGEELLAQSGLRSLADMDWVYWRVLDMKSSPDRQLSGTGTWWLFQNNPARYDIDRALRELPRLTWTTRRHAEDIEPGHRVFMYRTGADAAVVALATIESEPREGPEPEAELAYWRDAGDEGTSSGKRAWLRIDRVLDPPITRQMLLADPLLRELPNLKFAQATNYPVPPELASRLLSIVEGGTTTTPHTGDASAVPGALRSVASAAGLWFEPWVLEDIYLALRTKPFLILTGLSGTGKTKIALALQDLLCDEQTRAFVSVRPDWVDGRSLLGYHNLLTDTYVLTPVSRLLLDAEAEFRARGRRARPYILLLDEMNLARVEHYLADYLSVLESRRPGQDGRVVGDPIVLHTMGSPLRSAGDDREVPPTVDLAPNVYLIGTVNIDETTHPFSRKVLDRANVVELFDVDLVRSGIAAQAELGSETRGQVQGHFTRGGAFVDLSEPDLGTPWLTELVAVNAVLARDRLHFGYRVRNEVLAFIAQAGDGRILGEGERAQHVAFDLQLLQKVLPKLAGSRERLERPLRDLLEVCLTPKARSDERARRLADDPERLFKTLEGVTGGDGWSAVEQMDAATGGSSGVDDGDEDLSEEEPTVADALDAPMGEPSPSGPWPLRADEVRYPRSAKKIARMLLQLRDEGYASFFE